MTAEQEVTEPEWPTGHNHPEFVKCDPGCRLWDRPLDRTTPPPDEALGRVIVAEYADDSGAYEIGAAVAYTDKPTYVLEDATGRHTSWIAELCRYATAAEEIDYWRSRAFRAERHGDES